MLRITATRAAAGKTVVKIEGRLVDPWVTLLRETVEVHRKDGRTVVLDLSGVLFASNEGVELLRLIETDGVHCISWPPFLENL